MSLLQKNAFAIIAGASLVLLHLLVFGDIYSAMVSVPIFLVWVVISLAISLFTKKRFLAATFSAFIPILTCVFILGSARLQFEVAQLNAVKIGDALEKFHEKNG